MSKFKKYLILLILFILIGTPLTLIAFSQESETLSVDIIISKSEQKNVQLDYSLNPILYKLIKRPPRVEVSIYDKSWNIPKSKLFSRKIDNLGRPTKIFTNAGKNSICFNGTALVILDNVTFQLTFLNYKTGTRKTIPVKWGTSGGQIKDYIYWWSTKDIPQLHIYNFKGELIGSMVLEKDDLPGNYNIVEFDIMSRNIKLQNTKDGSVKDYNVSAPEQN